VVTILKKQSRLHSPELDKLLQPESHPNTKVPMPKTELTNLKHNVHDVCGKEVVRVHADIDKKIYDYLFLHVIAYTHGARQAIITFFFQRFYEACQDEQIPAVWDEESGPRILALLNRMNFNESKPKKVRKHE
jgi:hypothetical protein